MIVKGEMSMFKYLDKMSNKVFSAVKWVLTALSGLFTTTMIVMLES
jgi:hypothetical protein